MRATRRKTARPKTRPAPRAGAAQRKLLSARQLDALARRHAETIRRLAQN